MPYADPEKRKEWNHIHREHIREHSKKYRLEHLEEIRKREREYDRTHREQRKEAHKKWAEKHPEEYKKYQKYNSEQKKKYRDKHPEYRAKARERTRKWNLEHPERRREQRKKYRSKTNPDTLKKWKLTHRDKDRAAHRKNAHLHPEYRTKSHAKRRQLGFIPLNKHFDKAVGHHIDKDHILWIPYELHRSVAHNVWTGRGMAEINQKVYGWLGYIPLPETVRLI